MDFPSDAPGTDDVTFYAAFNKADGFGTPSGDKTHLTDTTISEDSSSTAIPSVHMMSLSLSVHPVPAIERSTISGMNEELGNGKVLLRDLQGSVVHELGELDKDPSSEHSFSLDADLGSGAYLLDIRGQ